MKENGTASCQCHMCRYKGHERISDTQGVYRNTIAIAQVPALARPRRLEFRGLPCWREGSIEKQNYFLGPALIFRQKRVWLRLYVRTHLLGVTFVFTSILGLNKAKE